MKFLDSHCHLHYEPLFSQLDEKIDHMRDKLSRMICISTKFDDTPRINEVIDRFSKNDFMIYSSVGLHPLEKDLQSRENIMQEVLYMAKSAKNLVAIGETGLDDFRAPLTAHQIRSFEEHLKAAIQLDLPVIMHTRCGENSQVEIETMRILQKFPEARIVAHCFGGSMDLMRFLVERGHLISFACNVGYKSARDLRDVAANVPLANIMIETDSPFLAPQSKRGSVNDPANVEEVAKVLCELHEMQMDELMRYVNENFDRFFGKIFGG